ncbi:hypothetical protein HMPREF9381_1143 [Streptococcus sanguinis SK72]|jgi:hypothetical protein|uniref:Uncharacterized protein n=1 Tax=Streptococcus sanguinis SK72 TaxID=888809 RepID=F0I1A2_STRSA|nr:hypothetical protein HMPREF9381_1143 [Streptococcus sanguinis SK72]
MNFQLIPSLIDYYSDFLPHVVFEDPQEIPSELALAYYCSLFILTQYQSNKYRVVKIKNE